ncbi:RHS repeat-associated core domain-containing protein, partial [Pseudomonas aeruginosa]|uniref:RHS repeat domain-containing protein n=1 Tax=Pseudomonas aeruginosa TaxID=287 RepID=UPI0011830D1B
MRIPPYFPRPRALALACALALPAQAAERAWSYSYNALGLIERADGPRTDVQDVTLYAYDSRGNLTQVTNAPPQVTRLGDYDERGKPGSITDANGVTSSLAYTGVDGWLASVSTAGSTTRFDYDAVGQITRVTRGDGSWLSYEYDDARRLVAIGNNLGERLEYDVDTKGNRNAGGQVASVTLAVGDKAPSTLVGQIAYLPFGPLLRLTWGNGITLSREYDQDYQLLRQKVGPWQSDYQHDANGNIQQHRHSLWGTLDYQYDPLDRLTEERGVQGGRSYAYDAVGNRTQRSDNPASGGTASSQDYQYAPDSNRLTAIGAQAVTSNAAGNLTQDRAARKLAYDAQGRLQSVSLDGQQVAEYRYNALGQRIVKLTPESVTTYLYGPDGQLLGEAEHDGSGRKLRAQYYLWLDSLPLATIDADYDAQGKVGNPTLLYLHGDHLDTPRLATDASGQIAWQWQSDAFGRGEALSQGSTQVNLRFPGQYYDAESGLHYNYFRDYDPETGRYVESDPIGLRGGVNTVGYV